MEIQAEALSLDIDEPLKFHNCMGTTQRLNVRKLFMRVVVPATWFAGYAVVGKRQRAERLLHVQSRWRWCGLCSG